MDLNGVRHRWRRAIPTCWGLHILGQVWPRSFGASAITVRIHTALAILFAVLTPLQALAHAQLRSTMPVDGSVVQAPPAQILLTFNEPVSLLALRLIDPFGASEEVSGVAKNNSVAIPVSKVLMEGTHLLSWRVVSTDGHPVGGTLTFHVGSASGSPTASKGPAAGVARAATTMRFVMTAALVIAVGAAVFAALVKLAPLEGRALRAGRIAAGVSLPVGVVVLGFYGLELLGLPVDAFLTGAPWQAAFVSPLAATVFLSVAAAVFSYVALGARSMVLRRSTAMLAWALAGLSFAVSGHATTAPPRWISAPAIALHAVALIFWMGALLPLLYALLRPGDDAVLRRFSSLAIPLVALLVLTGLALTWAQTAGDVSALVSSSYGRLLGAKLVLVLGLLALAARNRLVLTPAYAAGELDAAMRFARAIRVEILVGLVILAVASGFRLVPPPRAMAPKAQPAYVHIHGDRIMADVVLTPGLAGLVDVELSFQTGDFAALFPKEVEVAFAMEAAGIEPIRMDARADGDGAWRAGPVPLLTAGAWDITLRVLISDFESATLQDVVILE